MKTQYFREKVLFLRVKAGDSDAFGKIYDLFAVKIYRFIYFKVNSIEEAEDLTAETFLKTWQYIQESRKKEETEEDRKIENVRALLYKIARNLVVDTYRQRTKQETVSLSQNQELVDKITAANNLQKGLETTSEVQSIIKAVNQLKDEYREVIILRLVDELTISEIAKILDKSTGAVRVLLHRALKVLREVLDNE